MTPEKILSFWLDETNPKQWYAASKELERAALGCQKRRRVIINPRICAAPYGALVHHTASVLT